MAKNKNIFLNTLEAEEAVKAAETEKAELKAEKAAIEAREKPHAGEPQQNLLGAITEIKNGNVKVVFIKVLNEATGELEDAIIGDFPVSQDTEEIIEGVRKFAPNHQLRTLKDVREGMMNRMKNCSMAVDIIEAGIEVTKSFTVDGVNYFVCDGTKIRRENDGVLVVELKALPRLADEDYEEMVFPAVREAVAALTKETRCDDDDDSEFDWRQVEEDYNLVAGTLKGLSLEEAEDIVGEDLSDYVF